VEERLRDLGVRLERTPVGDRHVAQRMRETGARVGAEPSGHVVLEREGALIGDGLVAGVRMLQVAAGTGLGLAALRRETPRYPQILKGVRMTERRPLDAWPALQAAMADAEASLAGRGRILVRYSGTEPLLRIMAEGRDAGAVNAAVEALVGVAERG
jgi:phosphoglucosamine mutase